MVQITVGCPFATYDGQNAASAALPNSILLASGVAHFRSSRWCSWDGADAEQLHLWHCWCLHMRFRSPSHQRVLVKWLPGDRHQHDSSQHVDEANSQETHGLYTFCTRQIVVCDTYVPAYMGCHPRAVLFCAVLAAICRAVLCCAVWPAAGALVIPVSLAGSPPFTGLLDLSAASSMLNW